MATIPSIYINLEDDVSKIVTRLNRERSDELVLVCPKKCFLFNDSINLRLLKKQVDLLGKKIYILTMDERGQQYAQEAGFELKFLPKGRPATGMSDVKIARPQRPEFVQQAVPEHAPQPSALQQVVSQVKEIVTPKVQATPPQVSVSHEEPVFTEKSNVVQAAKADAIFTDEDVAEIEPRKKGSHNKLVMSFVAVSLIAIIAAVFIIIPRADVVVYAKSDPLTRDFKVSLSSSVNAVDTDKLILPSQKVSQEFEGQQQFQTQGKKPVGSKSEGLVVMYNFTKQPINLKSSTTQLIVGNKTYVLVPDLITVKPTRYKAGTTEVDPGSLGEPVQVRASQGGEEYNIPAETRMEITNQVFGSKPQFLFAKTSQQVTGGNSRFLSVVTDQDINNAFATLNTNLANDYKKSLSDQGLVLLDKGYIVEVTDSSTDKPVGSESPVFVAHIKSKVTAIVYKREDLQKLVQTRITQSLSKNRLAVVSNDDLDPKIETVDVNTSAGSLLVHYQGKAVAQFDLNDVSGELVGKSRNQVNEILRSKADVDKVDIVLAPSWQTNFPMFKNKINITVQK